MALKRRDRRRSPVEKAQDAAVEFPREMSAVTTATPPDENATSLGVPMLNDLSMASDPSPRLVMSSSRNVGEPKLMSHGCESQSTTNIEVFMNGIKKDECLELGETTSQMPSNSSLHHGHQDITKTESTEKPSHEDISQNQANVQVKNTEARTEDDKGIESKSAVFTCPKKNVEEHRYGLKMLLRRVKRIVDGSKVYLTPTTSRFVKNASSRIYSVLRPTWESTLEPAIDKFDHSVDDLIDTGVDWIQKGKQFFANYSEWLPNPMQNKIDSQKILAVACDVWVKCHANEDEVVSVHSFQEQLKARLKDDFTKPKIFRLVPQDVFKSIFTATHSLVSVSAEMLVISGETVVNELLPDIDKDPTDDEQTVPPLSGLRDANLHDLPPSERWLKLYKRFHAIPLSASARLHNRLAPRFNKCRSCVDNVESYRRHARAIMNHLVHWMQDANNWLKNSLTNIYERFRASMHLLKQYTQHIINHLLEIMFTK